MFNKSDIKRDKCQLFGKFAKNGYDWWWHSFSGHSEKTNKEKSFYIEFYLCNPKLAKEKPTLGQLPYNKENKIKPSYLMVNVGCWGTNHKQLHRFFSWKDINVSYLSPFKIKAEDCYLDEKETRGSIKITKEEIENHPEYLSDYGEVSWDLKIDKKIAFNVGYGAGSIFRRLQLFEMFWHAEGMKSFFEGYISIDGEKYIVDKDTCYGYADKNWGKDFTSPWLWLSSNNLTSKITGKKLNNSVFDIGGGRPKIAFLALKGKLLSAFYYEGKCYEFNFSKFWTFTRTKFYSKESNDEIIWHVEQKNIRYKMISDIRCYKKDMLLINYEAPNGTKKHNKLFNGGNGTGIVKLYKGKKLIDEIECKNVGCEYGEYDK